MFPNINVCTLYPHKVRAKNEQLRVKDLVLKERRNWRLLWKQWCCRTADVSRSRTRTREEESRQSEDLLAAFGFYCSLSSATTPSWLFLWLFPFPFPSFIVCVHCECVCVSTHYCHCHCVSLSMSVWLAVCCTYISYYQHFLSDLLLVLKSSAVFVLSDFFPTPWKHWYFSHNDIVITLLSLQSVAYTFITV